MDKWNRGIAGLVFILLLTGLMLAAPADAIATQAPQELWRIRVSDKQPTLAELDALTWDEQREARGWRQSGSPIPLDNGSILCVSIRHMEVISPHSGDFWLDEHSEMKQRSKYKFRIKLVSSTGVLERQQEFAWNMFSSVIPDPTGKFLALVVQDQVELSNEKMNEDPIILGLTDYLLTSRLVRLPPDQDSIENFFATDDSFYWIDSSRVSEDPSTYQNILKCADRKGNMRWLFDLPDTVLDPDNLQFDGIGPVCVDERNNVYVCAGDNSVYAIDQYGQLKWSTPTEIHPIFQPLVLPGGRLMIAGDPVQQNEPPSHYELELKQLDEQSDLTSEEQEERFLELFYGLWEEELKKPDEINILSADGRIETMFQVPAQVKRTPTALNNSRLVIGVANPNRERFSVENEDYQPYPDKVICISIKGEVLWEWELADELGMDGFTVLRDAVGTPMQILFTGGYNGSLYSLSTEGELLWSIELPGLGDGFVTVDPDGRLLVLADGELICYENPLDLPED